MTSRDDLSAEPQAGVSLGTRSVRGAVAISAAQAAKFLIRVSSQILIARLLLPEDYGLIAMVAPVLALVQLVADLGLGQAVVQRKEIKQADVSALFWLGTGINIAVAALVALLAPVIAYLYREPRLIPVSIVLAAVMPISGLATQQAALLSRNLRFGILAILDVAPSMIGLIGGFCAAWYGLGYWALVITTAGEAFTNAALVWSVSSWRPNYPALGPSTWALVQVGGHITGFNLAQYVTTTADNILLALTRGEAALGLYDKGYKIVTQPLSQLIAPAHRVAVPVLVRLLPEPDRYKRAYLGMLQLIAMASAPGLLFVLTMSQPLMLLLLGPKWGGIAPVISWLCVGGLASPLYTSTYWLFVSQGRAAQQLTYGTLTSLISVAGFIAGLHWGPSGVAAGAGLSFLVLSTPITCRGATLEGPIAPRNLLDALVPFLLPGVATAAMLVISSRFQQPEGFWLMLELPAAYGTFLLTLFALPTGRRLIHNIAQLLAMLKTR